jgi:DNA-binding NtrC family response regulator
MQILMEYAWPGNVRELRNLVESMVVLAPGREIAPDDIPREYRAGSRFLPVHVGPMLRGREGASGRELEFIVRSLVELKLQVEELRRRFEEGDVGALGGRMGGGSRGELVGEVRPAGVAGALVHPGALEPLPAESEVYLVRIGAGVTMAEIERAAIEAALRETRGNRRKAAEMLGIGERTLYRKLNEYQVATSGS